DGVTIFMNNTDKDIIIQKTAELDFEQVMMFNSLGQVIKTWDKDLDERDIALSVDEVSSGIYIINLITKQGLITKKILIE
ncbi:MAG: T9SS type A sorting domain-containing protein, partial [Flavobacteriaceae bacterium]|nr:T9SS type A sorting domain-containing protein [Flavobacteriaceae bacterium]